MNKSDFENMAGQILSELTEKGPVSITDLKKMVHFDEKKIFMALGWLFREDKITFISSDGENISLV